MHVDVCIRLILPESCAAFNNGGIELRRRWHLDWCRLGSALPIHCSCFREEDGALRGRVLAQNSERAR